MLCQQHGHGETNILLKHHKNESFYLSELHSHSQQTSPQAGQTISHTALPQAATKKKKRSMSFTLNEDLVDK